MQSTAVQKNIQTVLYSLALATSSSCFFQDNKSRSKCCISLILKLTNRNDNLWSKDGTYRWQLLIFYEARSESRYNDPLDLRGATLGNMNLKTEFQRFATASWPTDHTA